MISDQKFEVIVQQISPIIEALVSVGWLIFSFVALVVFRKQISAALTRLKKGNILGQSFELEEKIRKLEESAEEVASNTLVEESNHQRSEETNALVQKILEQKSGSPKLALMLLSSELERKVRQGLAIRGHLKTGKVQSVAQALTELKRFGLPENMVDSLKLFQEVRNKIVHGHSASDDDILRALDAGITILRAVDALPAERNFVYKIDIPFFEDEGCLKKVLNARAIILATHSPGGAIESKRIFPTTKTHFKVGKEVAWEWSFIDTWDACWYKDPETEEIKQAWHSSAEFVGRHLDEV